MFEKDHSHQSAQAPAGQFHYLVPQKLRDHPLQLRVVVGEIRGMEKERLMVLQHHLCGYECECFLVFQLQQVMEPM
jgi:hypothetical protein